MSDLAGNGTRSAKSGGRIRGCSLCILPCYLYLDDEGKSREGEEPRNRSAKVRHVMCVKAITRVVLIEECYADAVTRVS